MMHAPPYGPHNGPDPNIHSRLLSEPFPMAAPFLRVIVAATTSLGTAPLAYSINRSLTAALCYRLHPHTYESVILDQRYVQAWGLSKQDLWFTALGNMAQDAYDLQRFQTSTDTEVNVVKGHTWPGTAHVMRLVDLMYEPAPYGAVVMMPDTNTMLYSVLRSKRSLPMIPFIFQTFQSLSAGVQPLTDQLIWWRDGKVTGMSTRPGEAGAVQIAQSTEFSFLLDHELPG